MIGQFCPYCSKPVEFRKSSEGVYRKNYGPIWICSGYPECQSWVGCHPKTDKPLGRLANSELRKMKMKAHAHFDPLWKCKLNLAGGKKKEARGAAYRWLAQELGIPIEDCHIGMFDVGTCQRVIDVCLPWLRRLREKGAKW